MKISGFSCAQNTNSLYYPLEASLRSILPICDEFIIAIGKGNDGDTTRSMVENINDPKIRIIDTNWTEKVYEKGHVLSKQTNIALKECSGDWCFYLQADEVIHEKFLPVIYERCKQLLNSANIDGLLFDYKHFWGDYDHYQLSHAWYPHEIRIIRNNCQIQSWKDAQSFRKNGLKISVAKVNAEVYHYGWVRPPRFMQIKKQTFETFYGAAPKNDAEPFNYGPLSHLKVFKDTHPNVMKEWISKMDWKQLLDFTSKKRLGFKQDRLRYRIHTWIEQNLLGGKQLAGFKNYKLIKKV